MKTVSRFVAATIPKRKIMSLPTFNPRFIKYMLQSLTVPLPQKNTLLNFSGKIKVTPAEQVQQKIKKVTKTKSSNQASNTALAQTSAAISNREARKNVPPISETNTGGAESGLSNSALHFQLSH